MRTMHACEWAFAVYVDFYTNQSLKQHVLLTFGSCLVLKKSFGSCLSGAFRYANFAFRNLGLLRRNLFEIWIDS